MRLELELAIAFLRRRSGLQLRGTALAAFTGVALATTALIITMALMAGYVGAIATALQRGHAHLVGFSPSPMTLSAAADSAEELAGLDGVVTARPIAYLMGLIEDPQQPASPLPILVKAVSQPPEFTGIDHWPASRIMPAMIGAQLAAQLGLGDGDQATILLPPRIGSLQLPSLRVEVAGTFTLAYPQVDQGWLVVPLAQLLEALPDNGATGVELVLRDPLQVDEVRVEAENTAHSLLFTDWQEMNQALFTALRWQTVSLFVVLTLVVAVASFQVSSSLVVLALSKRRTSGMLQALGATPQRVRRVLILSGTLIGCSGVATGVVVGCIVSWLMSIFRVIRFPEGLAKVYMVDHIPLTVEPVHLVAVTFVCGLLMVVASVWPAWRASRLDPVAALRAV